nr:MAG TPA: hypothetical protein [Bacteriophage sp.]
METRTVHADTRENFRKILKRHQFESYQAYKW